MNEIWTIIVYLLFKKLSKKSKNYIVFIHLFIEMSFTEWFVHLTDGVIQKRRKYFFLQGKV